jgi:hypothetical protein
LRKKINERQKERMKEKRYEGRAPKLVREYIQKFRIEVKVKVKVKLFLYLTKHHAMRAYWEWRYSSSHSLTSALDGGEWSASRPGRFTPRERAPGTHWIGGWVGPRAVLDAVVKHSQPPPGIEPWNSDRPARSPALHRLSYPD